MSRAMLLSRRHAGNVKSSDGVARSGQPKIVPCRGVATASSNGLHLQHTSAAAHQQQQRASVIPCGLITLASPATTSSSMDSPAAAPTADRRDRHAWSGSDARRPPSYTILPCADPLQPTADRIHTIIGTAEACGLTKAASEDRYVVTDLHASTSGRDSHQSQDATTASSPTTATFTAVFDGHGGNAASHYATERMHLLVERDAKMWAALGALQDGTAGQAPADVARSWQRLFHTLDKDFLGAPLTSGRNAGSTALVAMCSGGWLTVANAGDSRAVLCRNGRAVRLSTDHSPEEPAERQRVEARGGSVKQLRGSWRIGVSTNEGRVTKYLAVSRALGDREFKEAKLVTVDPDVCLTRLQPGVDAFTVYASDGLWKVCDDDEVVECVKRILQECAKDPAISQQDAADAAAKALVQFARMRKSQDDVSVVIEMYV